MDKGCLIVFEGIDACGKGTMLSMTLDYLFNNFKEFDKLFVTREPTYSHTGRQIRKMLKEDSKPMDNAKKLLELYLDDRKEHLENVIRPVMARKSIILCDRYKHSTLAYQQTQGIPLQQLIAAHKRMLVPDLTLILDLPANIALDRISQNRGNFDKFEKKSFLEELRQNYLELPKFLEGENIKIIDASDSKEKVFERIKEAVLKVLPLTSSQ